MLSSDDFLFLYGCLGLYLGLSLVIIRRVAHAMAAIAEPLLTRHFGLDPETARGLIRSLIVGFYLINIGVVLYRLDPVNTRPDSPVLDIFARLGFSLLVLAATYFISLAIVIRLARVAQRWTMVSRTEGEVK